MEEFLRHNISRSQIVLRMLFSVVVTVFVVLSGYIVIRWLVHAK